MIFPKIDLYLSILNIESAELKFPGSSSNDFKYNV
jgi:hypothetical protein